MSLFLEVLRAKDTMWSVNYDVALTQNASKHAIDISGLSHGGDALKLGKIGDIQYHRQGSMLYCSRFYPFGQEGIEALSGTGVAEQIELIVLSDLQKRSGSSLHIHNPFASERRRNQLERIGIDWQKRYSIEEYIGIVEKSIRSPR